MPIPPIRQAAAAVALMVAAAIAPLGTAEAEPLKVALLTPGPIDDGGFNQAAADAARKLESEGLVTVEIRPGMADPKMSEPVIREFASAGYDLVIGHGVELTEPMLAAAADFPGIRFAADSAPEIAERLAPNVDGWTYNVAEVGYLSGWLAGRIAGVTKVGAVGGPQLPFIVTAHKGFALGLHETNPDAVIVERFTGAFDDADKAEAATREILSQGAQLIWTSGDGMGRGVAAAAAEAGVFTMGVTGDAGGLADQVNVASVVIDMYPTFRAYVDDIIAGRFGGSFFTAGLANGGLKLTRINAVVPGLPDSIEAEIDDLIDQLATGKKVLPPIE
jgi:basic membrane lipoprotein Med (substrate-binding protein (PBP1-ABC) superfamily)